MGTDTSGGVDENGGDDGPVNPKGMGLGLALGVGIGAALGVATDDVGIWLAVGAGIGTAFGAAFSTQFDDE
ncbi:hypothetical protein [Halococcus salsus]|uniref:hypothetical protein n=1 Tax=Halococcus salsus TaxID=2162894 RepID=UPI001359FC76|nr:hypothetical protein [Halococcus salsus]